VTMRTRSSASLTSVIERRAISRPTRALPRQPLHNALGINVADRKVPDYPIAYDAGKRWHAVAKAKKD